MRIADYFDGVADRQAAHPALIEDYLVVDLAQQRSFAHSATHAPLAEPGLAPGTHVVLYAPNHLRVPLLLLATNRADTVWLSAHTRNPVNVNIEVLTHIDREFLFFHSAYEHVIPKLNRGLPHVRRFICIDRESGIRLEDPRRMVPAAGRQRCLLGTGPSPRGGGAASSHGRAPGLWRTGRRAAGRSGTGSGGRPGARPAHPEILTPAGCHPADIEALKASGVTHA